MKILFTIVLSVLSLVCTAQVTDTALIRKLSINGVCLCNTTFSSLKQSTADFTAVDVEEMDLPKGCYGKDSRFVAGKGIASVKYPGMIFQKDQTTDQVSKIRLTRDFKGRLPDGKYISMDKLLLKDLLKLYPNLKNAWGSRGCSNYWNFSNDTLSFYVKIDQNKQPQFPIDEAYYQDKPVEAADLVVSCYSFGKHDLNVAIKDDDPNDPIFYLDSVRVNKGVLESSDPSEFASINVFKNKTGPENKNGVVFFETKRAAKERYWEYFKSRLPTYGKIVPDPEKDSNVQYILNKKLLHDRFELSLSAVNNKNFISIAIINKDQLIKEYGISDKDYGVVINADVPDSQ